MIIAVILMKFIKHSLDHKKMKISVSEVIMLKFQEFLMYHKIQVNNRHNQNHKVQANFNHKIAQHTIEDYQMGRVVMKNAIHGKYYKKMAIVDTVQTIKDPKANTSVNLIHVVKDRRS